MEIKRMNEGETVFSILAGSDPAFEGQHLKTLKNKLKQVMWLCRLFNRNVEIIYECEKRGLQKVMTKVWLTTSKNILLMDGVSIPAVQVREIRVL